MWLYWFWVERCALIYDLFTATADSWMIKAGSSDTILKIDTLKIIQAYFGLNWYNGFRDVK